MVICRRKRQTAEIYNVLGGICMEWIIFVDLGLVVAVVAIAAILAAIGVAGVVV